MNAQTLCVGCGGPVGFDVLPSEDGWRCKSCLPPIEPVLPTREPSSLEHSPFTEGGSMCSALRVNGSVDSLGEDRTDQTVARARALGITMPLDKPFRCVLAGHQHLACLRRHAKGY